jgi:DNA-directed RNA polymerase specialized sigma24 family protein
MRAIETERGKSDADRAVLAVTCDVVSAHKAVLLLHDADGLTADEIAHLLQLPLTTVKMRLHRARRQLETALNEACAFGHDERGVFVREASSSAECQPRSRLARGQ